MLDLNNLCFGYGLSVSRGQVAGVEIAGDHFRLDLKQFSQMLYRTDVVMVNLSIFEVTDMFAADELISFGEAKGVLQVRPGSEYVLPTISFHKNGRRDVSSGSS